MTSRESDLVGTVLAGRYRVLEVLGSGAMGTVYLGEHLKIGRRTALKVLQASDHDPGAIARFTRGARNAARLDHPNVCRVFDFGDPPGGLHFLAMEFVEGVSLLDVLAEEGSLEPDRAISIAIQTANALQAAHDIGIVHRDLKPGNIMLTRAADGSEVVKVVDFDIAKEITGQQEAEVTTHGWVVGTPEYMSPEQFMGGALDGRSDIYSLGLIVFRMLTGRFPFSGVQPREIMLERMGQDPMTLAEATGDDFPEAIEAAVQRALKAAREDRWSSAEEFGRALREALGYARIRLPEHPMTPHSGASTTGPSGSEQPTASHSPGRDSSVPATIASPASRVTGTLSQSGKKWRPLAAVGAVVLAGGVAWTLLSPPSAPPGSEADTFREADTIVTEELSSDGSATVARSSEAGPPGEEPETTSRGPRVAALGPPPGDDEASSGPGSSVTSVEGEQSDTEAWITADQAIDSLNTFEDRFVELAMVDKVPEVEARHVEVVANRIFDHFDDDRLRAQAAFMLSKALSYQGQAADARRWGQEAVRLDPTADAYRSWFESRERYGWGSTTPERIP